MKTLVVRLDSLGDVLLAGPALRAVAAGSEHVTLLVGPRGEAAARMLPGVSRIITWHCPWIDAEPQDVNGDQVTRLIETLAAGSFDRAVILTSFHQSALPTALLLRLAGVQSITAISEDYAGSLLDKRVAPDWSLHEVDRSLQVANAAGFAKPAHDNGGLALRQPLPPVGNLVPRKPYVVLHPGTSVPARAWPAEKFGATAQLLRARGTEVVVTGSANERAITTSVVTGSDAVDLTGRTDLPHLASVLAGAEAVVIANTGPAHLAAAVGTPVVSLFAPTVSAQNWGPYGVPSVVLGDQGASCRGSRARVCPVPGHPCLGQVDPKLVLVAIEQLAGARTDPRWDRREPA